MLKYPQRDQRGCTHCPLQWFTEVKGHGCAGEACPEEGKTHCAGEGRKDKRITDRAVNWSHEKPNVMAGGTFREYTPKTNRKWKPSLDLPTDKLSGVAPPDLVYC